MIEVSNYDYYDYDYAQYWKNRRYEDNAERQILNNIFAKKKGDWFIDIGGSYGRLTETYYHSYSHPIILDYSLKTLQKNYSVIKKHFPSIELIAANAYHMPFKEDTFDGGLMVRVLHHISEPAVYYKELRRIMHNGSTYIQEFANKMNLKASLRAIINLNFKYFSSAPYQQPSAQNFEGTKKGEEAIFLSYKPEFIEKLLNSQNFKIINKFGCSYLRSTTLKKILGEDKMIKIEKVLQKILKTTNIPPSIIYESRLTSDHIQKNPKALTDILVCPKCNGKLDFKGNSAYCPICKLDFKKKSNVWDFRID
jgi:ubiquinone/menaquinone biosynthesis C-methylase UbiE